MKQRLSFAIKKRGKERFLFVVVSDITELCFAFFFFLSLISLFLGKLACEGICVERISVTGFSSCHSVCCCYCISSLLSLCGKSVE